VKKHSSPFVPGFVRSKNTLGTKWDETSYKGGFVPSFVPILGPSIGKGFRHQTSLVSSPDGRHDT
jgi:hypothetical protein